MKGEVLVIVDLFTRETILQWLPSRKQEQVAHTILRRVIFERGVPLSIRSDNAPELMKGVIHKICKYLKKIHLDLIKTGKKNMQSIRITNTFLYNNLRLENNKKILYLMLIHLYSK